MCPAGEVDDHFASIKKRVEWLRIDIDRLCGRARDGMRKTAYLSYLPTLRHEGWSERATNEAGGACDENAMGRCWHRCWGFWGVSRCVC